MAGRDRFVDALRVYALAMVVLLHWLMLLPSWQDGRWVDVGVVDFVPALWPVTWVGDVMPLFFFAGGFANAVSYDSEVTAGGSTVTFLRRRYRRLLAPTAMLFGIWFAAELLVRFLGHPEQTPLQHIGVHSTAPFGPLWFLGVYLVLVTLTPLTVRLEARHGWSVVVPVVGLVAVADLAAVLTGRPAPLAVNLVLVWLVPTLLGHSYAAGRFGGWSARRWLGIAAAALVALALLTSLPWYPRNLVHPRWTVLNIDAPTLPLVASALWLVALAMVLRPVLDRWLERPAPAHRLAQLNTLTMPVYLWHMTAYIVAAVALGATGLVFATSPTPEWWAGRPLVVVGSALALAAMLGLARLAGVAFHRPHEAHLTP